MHKSFCIDVSFHYAWVYIWCEIMGFMFIPCLFSKEIARLFSKVVEPFYILTGNGWRIQFLHIFTITCLFYYSHPSGYDVVFHCGLYFPFLMTNDVHCRFIYLQEIHIPYIKICIFKSYTNSFMLFCIFNICFGCKSLIRF